MSENQIINNKKDATKRVESLFKTPLRPLAPTSGNVNKLPTSKLPIGINKQADEFTDLDLKKLLNIPVSDSADKAPPATPKQGQAVSNSASAKKNDALKSTFKFDPDCVTGIPWIKPKKTTVVKPFNFASDSLKAKRVAKDATAALATSSNLKSILKK